MQTIYMPFGLEANIDNSKITQILLLEITPDTAKKIQTIENEIKSLTSSRRNKFLNIGVISGVIKLNNPAKWAIFNDKKSVLHKGVINTICYRYNLGVIHIELPEFEKLNGYEASGLISTLWSPNYIDAMKSEYTSLARTDRWVDQYVTVDNDLECETPKPKWNVREGTGTAWLGLNDGSVAVITINKDEHGFKQVRCAGAPKTFDSWIGDTEKASRLVAGEWCPDDAKILDGESCIVTYFAGNNYESNLMVI